ncbi:MAG: hypothetical protein Q9195_001242 [Heterodermia aff. obscurata]
MMPFSIPFFLHIIGEFGAATGFFLRPSQTLNRPQPDAHAVIRQYALLLTSTNLIAAIFLFQSQPTPVSTKVAGALALYHLGPLTRAGLKGYATLFANTANARAFLLSVPMGYITASGLAAKACLISVDV